MYVKNQCHPKRRSMLNHVPNLAHCETKLKFVYIKTQNKTFEIPKFSEKSTKEHCKNYMYQISIGLENEVKNCPI